MGITDFWKRKVKESREVWEGKGLLDLEHYNQAIECFLKAIQKDPQDIEAHFCMGEVYIRQQNKPEALKWLLKTADLKPDKPMVSRICELVGMKRIASDQYYNTFPSFSPDGRKVVYCSARRDTNGDNIINALDNRMIMVVDVDGKNEIKVVDDKFYNAFPRFSPDGKKIVFASRRRDVPRDESGLSYGYTGIYVVDIVTGKEQQVVSDLFHNKYPSFSPDGKRILYLSRKAKEEEGYEDTFGHSGVYLVDIDGKNAEEIVPPIYENTFPSFSRDGRKIVYASWRDDTNGDGIIDLRDNTSIYVMDLNTMEETQIIDANYNNSFPSFSPDSKKIVFLSKRKFGKFGLGNSGIYIRDIKGKNERYVVSDEYSNRFASFSPDGKQILFLRELGEEETGAQEGFFGTEGIYVVDVATGKERQVISDKYFSSAFPTFSPRGGKITYVSWKRENQRGLYIADTESVPTIKELRTMLEENLR